MLPRRATPSASPWPILVIGLCGVLLTHGVAIACLAYCLVIQPARPLLHAHHHGDAAADQHRVAASEQKAGWTFPDPILLQGSEAPVAVAAAQPLMATPAHRIYRPWTGQATCAPGWNDALDPPPRQLFMLNACGNALF